MRSMTRVLIVDDSNSHCATVARMLQRRGYEVFKAKDAEHGLSVALEKNPDIILMDVVMPGPSGFEATRALKANELTKHIPIVLLSAKQGMADKHWGLQQGAAAYLAKPVQEKQLLEALQTVLKRP